MNDGRWAFFGALGLALLVAVVWALRLFLGKGQVKQLREQYLRETGLPLGEAYSALERHLERAMARRPGRPMEWYLRDALKELRRDRR